MKLTYKYVSLSGIDQFFTECWYVFYFREKSYENNFSRFYSLMNLFFWLCMYFPNYVFFLKNISKVRYYVRVCVKQLGLAFQYLDCTLLQLHPSCQWKHQESGTVEKQPCCHGYQLESQPMQRKLLFLIS